MSEEDIQRRRLLKSLRQARTRASAPLAAEDDRWEHFLQDQPEPESMFAQAFKLAQERTQGK